MTTDSTTDKSITSLQMDTSDAIQLDNTLDTKLPFTDVCTMFEKISSCDDSDLGKKDSFYPIMRLCLPHLDRKRAAYGMKETVLARYYIEVLGIAKTGADATKLLNYRAPSSGKTQAGDFAAVAYFVLKNRCPENGTLMVSDVNCLLNKIAVSNAAHDRVAVKQILQQMLRSTTAIEQKWLIRIIMKELKLGINENSILSLFHIDAVDLFSVCADLEKVCVDLREPSFRLNEAAIQLFLPFRPMLGQRASIPQAVKLTEGQMFYVETKFDGDRMQLHKDGTDYKYFSRSSKDYTSSFGASSTDGSFTPQIHSAFKPEISCCILDGEMVGYDVTDDSFVPKGDNIDVKAFSTQLTGKYEGMQQCFVVFDILMINGRNLANLTLRERALELAQVFTPVKGLLHLVDRLELTSREELVTSLNDAIDRREEGLLVKLPNSTYQPDKRKGSGWLKLKPEYMDSLSDQLDLLILGGYYGSGKRGGIVSHFLLGVAETTSPGNNPSRFLSFCKVGTGYTLSELRILSEELGPYWKPFNSSSVPDSIVLTVGNKEKPDLLIEPEFSKIVQIRAAEITVSDKYSCACTLRFPRLELFREDKEWYQCMTMEELENIKQSSSGRLAHAWADGFEDIAVKKRRISGGRRIAITRGVASQFRGANVDDVEVTSNTFEGKEFYVVNGSPDFSKNAIELKIASYGGSFRQNPTPDTFCVLVHDVNFRVKNIIKTRKYNVVKLDWFIKCVEEDKFIPLMPHHMIFTETDTKQQFKHLYDEYGDSFTEPCESAEFLSLCRRIATNHKSDYVAMSHPDIADIKDKYIDDARVSGLFRHYTFYVDRYGEMNSPEYSLPLSPLELVGWSIRYNGGSVSRELVRGVTHVIIDEGDMSRVREIKSIVKSFDLLAYIVTSKWVEDSIKMTHIRPEKMYTPVT
ncbi:DNA ligase 4-like [Oopsacas minuta]|uniref:DNA ligase n=1 Tax=Oopsacas minuta TaxID=111878 RepID=A0AAV7KKV2_9METZ|nr:DNA ligase 4-like [Oopsacas minuta]